MKGTGRCKTLAGSSTWRLPRFWQNRGQTFGCASQCSTNFYTLPILSISNKIL